MSDGVLRTTHLVLFAVLFISIGARADDRQWISRGFKPANRQYKYFVGISAPFSNAQDAMADARNNAAILLVQQEFSTNAEVSLKTSESTNAIAVSSHSTVKLKDVNLSQFELEDQDIEKVDDDTPKYIVKALYKYDQTKLAAERQRLIAINQNHSQLSINDDQLSADLRRAEAEKKKREEDAKLEAKVWKEVFPRLGLDFDLGYGSSRRVEVFEFGLGLRLKLLSRVYLGISGYYGIGSDRKARAATSTTQSTSSGNSTTSTSSESSTSSSAATDTTTSNSVSDTDENAGVQANIRLYLVRSPRSGFYVKGLVGYDYDHVTCTKDTNGICSNQPRPSAQGLSAGGGLGFQLGNEHFYWLETTAEKSSNPNIGYLFGARIGFTWGLIK